MVVGAVAHVWGMYRYHRSQRPIPPNMPTWWLVPPTFAAKLAGHTSKPICLALERLSLVNAHCMHALPAVLN